MDSKDQISGVLYGLAIGDAFGMPPEFLTRDEIHRKYGRITDFLDGDEDNEISRNYTAGQYTDDTGQALAVLDSLMETGFVPDADSILRHLLTWADREDAFSKGLLGPTSTEVLSRIKAGDDPYPIACQAVSNGAAMRIAPVGTLFDPADEKALCRYVADICRVTHASDAAIAGACMVAMAVSAAAAGKDKEQMIQSALHVESFARTLGAPTKSPSLLERTREGLKAARKYEGKPELFAEELSLKVGSGGEVWESVPAALCIAWYWYEVPSCAVFCANYGGDTDTIGAMASAICGGAKGARGIPEAYINVIKKANQADFEPYIDALFQHRFAPGTENDV